MRTSMLGVAVVLGLFSMRAEAICARTDTRCFCVGVRSSSTATTESLDGGSATLRVQTEGTNFTASQVLTLPALANERVGASSLVYDVTGSDAGFTRVAIDDGGFVPCLNAVDPALRANAETLVQVWSTGSTCENNIDVAVEGDPSCGGRARSS
ncbi:MAG TPA: hypothetical protein VGE37_04490, partial [Archangium sp.]